MGAWLIQSNGRSETAGSTTRTIAFDRPVHENNLLVVCAVKGNDIGVSPFVQFTASDVVKSAGTATIDTIVMDKLSTRIDDGSNATQSVIFSAKITGSGTLTLQITLEGTDVVLTWCAAEFFGIYYGSIRAEGANGATGTSTTPDPGSITSGSGALFVGAFATGSGSTLNINGAANYVLLHMEVRASPTYNQAGFQYRIVSTGTASNASWTISASIQWSAIAVCYTRQRQLILGA